MSLPVLSLVRHAGDGKYTMPRQGPFPWQVFYRFRNVVLETLRPFGTVGPMGATPISEAPDVPGREWQLEASDPAFFVVDDWWFGEQVFVRVELHPSLVTTSLLEALASMLTLHPGWAVALALFHGGRGRGYILVFSDRIMKEGRLFWFKSTPSQLVAACARFSTQGAA